MSGRASEIDPMATQPYMPSLDVLVDLSPQYLERARRIRDAEAQRIVRQTVDRAYAAKERSRAERLASVLTIVLAISALLSLVVAIVGIISTYV